MGDKSKYLAYSFNIGRRKDKFGRRYVSFGDDCSEVDFTKACSGKLVIPLSRVNILRIKVEDLEKKC